MSIASKIKELVEQQLQEHNMFIVSENISANGEKIQFFVDGDQAVSISNCASVSRKVSKIIDETELAEEKFLYEISSPGADKPLKLLRQYPKHVGRTFEIILKDNTMLEGKLLNVTDNIISIEWVENKKNPKKGKIETIEIPFENIKESKITISFK